MEDIVLRWNEMNILNKVLEHKLLFIETKDVAQTSIALDNFRRAGKVAEGIDFNGHYGRAVLMYGIPFQYTLSKILRVRLDYLRENYGINEADFLNFDAMRQCAQCVGRIIRSKQDYGVMIFADKRYTRNDKKEKLPKWIKDQIL
eukprot:CAMPEP_0115029158 /NCGR_PEP_ID=MMETSP0216-20121206/36811_1 /TAXON_ID=223996 /ORGANISM="Protocruzia adherens, Strain Boccale" /LENGTH=144 /DNA_ID=CAMNT_0002405643 /DNA_START=1 /DNA_END=433 /DNA_ORIENTATION=-